MQCLQIKFANSIWQVVDVGPQLSEVYSQVDPCSLEVLLIEVGYTDVKLFWDESEMVMHVCVVISFQLSNRVFLNWENSWLIKLMYFLISTVCCLSFMVLLMLIFIISANDTVWKTVADPYRQFRYQHVSTGSFDKFYWI